MEIFASILLTLSYFLQPRTSGFNELSWSRNRALVRTVAWSVEVVAHDESAQTLELTTHVALRPLACVPDSGGSGIELRKLGMLFELLGAPAAELVDQRHEPDLDLAPPQEATRGMSYREKRNFHQAKRGDLVNRLLHSLETLTAMGLTDEAPSPAALRTTLRPFQARALAWMLAKERAVPADIVALRTQQSSGMLWHGRGM